MTRPIILVTAAAALITALLAITAARGSTTTALSGDLDCSGTVTMTDAARALAAAAQVGTAPPCLPNGDVDCDGHHTAADALRIAAYVAHSPLPAPAGCLPVGSTPTPSPSTDGSPPPAPTQSPTATATPSPGPTPTPTVTPQGTATPTRTPTPTPAHATPTPTPLATFQAGVEPTCNVFPADNPWNTDISSAPVDAKSADYLAAIGTGGFLHPDFGTVWAGAPIGIPYVIVGADQPKVPVSFYYNGESDPGPYPIPPSVPVEGQPVGQPNSAGFGGDRHVIIIDDSACKLYEMFDAHPVNGGQSWDAGSGAVFDLNSNALRPEGWTSADAAGLPIFPGLVRYSEVQSGVIDHAIRFTVSDTQMAYIHPATHFASDITDADYPPMGLRFRMKADYDCSWADPQVQVICTAMKKYGMIVADNGADWYVSGAPDSRWDDDRIGDLKDIPASAFQVVDTGEAIHTGY